MKEKNLQIVCRNHSGSEDRIILSIMDPVVDGRELYAWDLPATNAETDDSMSFLKLVKSAPRMRSMLNQVFKTVKDGRQVLLLFYTNDKFKRDVITGLLQGAGCYESKRDLSSYFEMYQNLQLEPAQSTAMQTA